MKRSIAPLVLAAFLAGPALGAPPPSDPPLTIDGPHAPAAPRPRLFLSPSGEPFRPAPGAPEPFDAWFAAADANHDGVIDRAEFRADAARFFKRLDPNGDSVIDGFEVGAYENKIVPELGNEAEGRFASDTPGAEPRGPDGDHGPGGRLGAGGPRGLTQLLDEPEPVSGADFGLDGHITLAEWMQAADQRFDLLDTARTGRLAHDQLKALLLKPIKRRR